METVHDGVNMMKKKGIKTSQYLMESQEQVIMIKMKQCLINNASHSLSNCQLRFKAMQSEERERENVDL